MKRKIFLLLVAGLFASLAFLVTSTGTTGDHSFSSDARAATLMTNPADDEVIFYEHTNYGGGSFSMTVGTDNADLRYISAGNWNDKVSSLKLGKNVCVTAYENINYGGATCNFIGSGQCVRGITNLVDWGWNDKMSSIKVKNWDECGGVEPESNQVIFYEHKNFQGSYQVATVDGDVKDMRSWNSQNWNDRVSSMKIGSDVCVTIWENINYGGAKSSMTGNQGCVMDYMNLVNNGWNDKMSSFKIRLKEIGCAQ
jgi:hypothetical protein